MKERSAKNEKMGGKERIKKEFQSFGPPPQLGSNEDNEKKKKPKKREKKGGGGD